MPQPITESLLLKYKYVKIPFIGGSVYVEYNKDNHPLCGWEWCCDTPDRELFLYVRKIRIIYTPPSWRLNGQTNGKGNGTTGSPITNPSSDRTVQRTGLRNTDTDRCRVSDCG